MEWNSYGICDQCGEKDVAVEWTENPFAAEVHPESENEPSYWCQDCYTQSSMDI